MRDVTRQLEHVRRAARVLLVSRRFLQWIAGTLAAAMTLGLLDFALRLPDWLRLILLLAAVAVAGSWLITRVRRAMAFRPDLAELALRAERIYPHLAGNLASAVEFSTHEAAYAAPASTAALVRASVERARAMVQGVQLSRLIDPSRTLRALTAALIAAAVMATGVILSPASAQTAAHRWLLPLGAPQWPRRVQVASATEARVWAVDTPLPVRATIGRGYQPSLRVWAHYRFVEPGGEPGPWHDILMNEQPAEAGADPRYERLIEVPASLAQSVQRTGEPGLVQLRLEAYDDQTPVQSITLVARPAVVSATAIVQPPEYAADLVDVRRVDLDDQPGPVAAVAALAGSLVQFELTLNKPLPDAALAAEQLLPGISPGDVTVHAELVDGEPTVRFALAVTGPMQTAVQLTDAYGLSSVSDRLYQVELLEDRPPSVSIVEPAADASVLPSAVVPVQAVAQDDVGLRQLTVEARVPGPQSNAPDTTSAIDLAQVRQRRANLEAQVDFDLQPLSLRPGDVVLLGAQATDVFDLDGLVHEPAAAPPRRLRIIDQATLVGQVRQDLAALRQQAIRLESQQRDLIDAAVDPAAAQQPQVTDRLASQQRLLQQLDDRLEQNRLEEPALQRLIDEAARLVDQAQQASRSAAQQLSQARQAEDQPSREAAEADARQQQQQVAQDLRQLNELLDQGRDALSLQLALRDLQARQAQLAQDARELLPRTIGQDRDALPQDLQRQLDELAQRQSELGQQAGDMVSQMQSTAEALAQPGASDQQMAAAQALLEAAAMAQRQGLSAQMQQAGQQAQQNQLAQASSSQASAMATMEQMMQELGRQQERSQAMLRRRLQELVEALRQLVDRQQRQIAVLREAQPDGVSKLEPGLSALRRTTIAVQEQARGAEETAPVAGPLGAAVDAQASAIVALRQEQGQDAETAQREALRHLEAALQMAQQQQEQQQQEEAQRQREELRQQYLALAQRQEQLRERVAAFEGPTPLTRRQRADLLELSSLQRELAGEARALGERVAQTIVLSRLHQWIDAASQRVVNQLSQARANQDVQREQGEIASWLREMADALQPPPPDERFAEGGGGGGGGGGGQQPEVVPPLAELKALRGVQQQLYQQTRQLAEQNAAPAEARVLEVAARQQALAELGQQMIEQVKQDATPNVSQPGDQGEPDPTLER